MARELKERIKLYVFGRPKDTLKYMHVQEMVIAASSEDQALEIVSCRDDNEDCRLKKVIEISQLTDGYIIL